VRKVITVIDAGRSIQHRVTKKQENESKKEKKRKMRRDDA
jgi:hypothetical protein